MWRGIKNRLQEQRPDALNQFFARFDNQQQQQSKSSNDTTQGVAFIRSTTPPDEIDSDEN